VILWDRPHVDIQSLAVSVIYYILTNQWLSEKSGWQPRKVSDTGKKIQHTIVTTVGETAEKFNLDHHHYIEPLSKTETMHASTMNHTRSCNRDVSPDPLLE